MGFPNELKNGKNWVCWRKTPDKDGGKPRKVPISPLNGRAAKSNDPGTWGTYQQAVDACKQFDYTGIGFMFTAEDHLVGVDIDHCIDPETGEFNEVAKAVIAKQPTYVEKSPSGTGVHLLFKGTKPKGGCKNTESGVEMYDSGRYFTVTGIKVDEATDTVADDAGTLQWIHDTYIRKPKAEKGKKRKNNHKNGEPLTDEEVIEHASAASDGAAFIDLMEGKWEDSYASASEADLAFMNKLAFWTAKDAVQMDRIFRTTKLFREKWDQPHRSDGTTYGQETIAKAVESCENIYSPGGEEPIFEYAGCYYRNKSNGIAKLTNFTVVPVEMIKADGESQLTCKLVNDRGESFDMSFMTQDMSSMQKFRNLLTKQTIALCYFGTDSDIELFKEYICKLDWTVKEGVKALGIYRHDGKTVFATKDGAMDRNATPVDSIIQVVKYVDIETRLPYTDPLSADALKKLGPHLMGYNVPEKTIPILAWVAGCFIKEHLRWEGIKFPLLFLIGEAGSGKSTTLENVVLPIFSTSRVTAASQATSFTLMKRAASSNLVPLALDEFKPSKLDKVRINTLYNHFRDSYDGHDGIRGRADQSAVTYDLSAPLVVAGEEAADETAIRERTIELLFAKKDLTPIEHKYSFKIIRSFRTQLEDLGRMLLLEALGTESGTVKEWYDEGVTLLQEDFPSRVVNNMACCYAGLKLVEKVILKLGLTWNEVFPFKLEDCPTVLEVAEKDYLLDGTIHNTSTVEETLEVMSRMGLDPKNDFILSDDHRMLFIRIKDVYDRYLKYCKDYALPCQKMNAKQFCKQLKHTDYYIADQHQKKFNGKNARCFVLDYGVMKENCEVYGFEADPSVPLA